MKFPHTAANLQKVYCYMAVESSDGSTTKVPRQQEIQTVRAEGRQRYVVWDEVQAKRKRLTCFDSSIPDFCLSSPYIHYAELGSGCIKSHLPMFICLLTL